VKQQVQQREQIAAGVGNATPTEGVKNPLAYLRATPLQHLLLRPAKRT
jgi:hypothetical protein